MGSSVYGFVARWVPKGLVGWMMGVRKVGTRDEREFGRSVEWVVGEGTGATSPGSPRSYGAADMGLYGSEYISVHGDKGREVQND